jgi:polyribonucleotide nucleotidyltransferase
LKGLDVLDTMPEHRTFIIPVRLDPCSPSHNKLFDLHWVDIFENFESGIEKMARTVLRQNYKKISVQLKPKNDFDVLLEWAKKYIDTERYSEAESVLYQCTKQGSEDQKIVAINLLKYVKEKKESDLNISVGDIFRGRVSSVQEYGVFVTITPGKEGIVHISNIRDEMAKNIKEHFKVGDFVLVKVLAVYEMDRISLDMKDIDTTSAQWKYA